MIDMRTAAEKTVIKKSKCCIIYSGNTNMVAKSLERKNNNWFFQTKAPSDLIIKIGGTTFHLHKLPMISRSALINRMVFQNGGYGRASVTLEIDNLPGGAKTFELVAKFCYGWKVNLAAKNVALLHCAAHFLDMSEDLERGNFILKTDVFLNYTILSSWKGIFQILKSCESIPCLARDLRILERCSEAIAWKVYTYESSSSNEHEIYSDVHPNTVTNFNLETLSDRWWLEDISFLRIDHFIEVINSLKGKKIQPDLVGSCIVHWTRHWLTKLAVGQDNLNQKNHALELHRVTVERLIKMLPAEENSVSCNFLLHLFKVAIMMKIDCKLLNRLERRIVFMLETCSAKDLIIKNSTTLLDVGIVTQLVEAYAYEASRSPQSRIHTVGRLVDEYLMLVARDEKLPAQTFQLLVESLPRNARYCNDKLYRAIDMYLKAHPNLIEEERMNLCRFIEYHKLSEEARWHAVRNNRLPVNMTTQLMLLEQVNMAHSLTAPTSNFRRTKSQAILRVSKGLGTKGQGKTWVNSQKDINVTKQDVEVLKSQLSKLQLCRMELQRHIKKA